MTTIPEPSIPGNDILNLNVFTPRPRAANGPEELLPVLVYIHGGGYVAAHRPAPGTTASRSTETGLSRSQCPIGWALTASVGLPDAPCRGILDWLLALEWVRDNIGQFGGDPARNDRRPVCRRWCGDDALEYTPSARTVHGCGVNL